MRRIRLNRAGCGRVSEESFGRSGIVFIVASVEGPLLSREPLPGQIVYAVIVRSGRRTFCAVMGGASFASRHGCVDEISKMERIAIGVSEYSVELHDRVDRGRISRMAAYISASIVIAVILGGVAWNAIRSDRQPRQSMEIISTEASRPGQESVSKLIDDAREHIRAGRIGQARLSLMEATEIVPDDQEAWKLMAGIDKVDGVKEVALNKKTQLEDEALEIFREGERLKDSGDLRAARLKFDRAAEMLQGVNTKPPFAEAFNSARDELMKKLKESLSPRISDIEKMVAGAEAMAPPEAFSSLSSIRKEMELILTSLPGEGAAISLKNKIDAAAKSASSKWLAGALAAEKYSGCAKAMPMYREISSSVGEMEPVTSTRAREGIDRCGKAGER